jgi:hypothetical protein
MRGFYKTRVVCRIAQRPAQLVDRSVQTVLEVHKCVGRPKLLAQLLARDDLARLLQQHGQNSKGLFLNFDLEPVLVQLSGAKVSFEDPEVDNMRDQGWVGHRPSPSISSSLPLA